MKEVVFAAAFASMKHRDQRRKDQEASPYINHPLALANLLCNEVDGIDDRTVVIGAILHDTIEDTATTKEEVAGLFGDQVAELVMEVTDDKTLPKAERKRLQIEHAPDMSYKAKLIKLADKICNLRDMANSPPADWPMSRRIEYFDWAKAVVDGLRGTHAGLESLFDAAYGLRPQ